MKELIRAMGSSNDQARQQAAQALIDSLVGRPFAEGRPHLLQPLVDLFRTSDSADVRSACVQAATEWAEEGKAPPLLIEALCDPDPNVVVAGVFALNYFPDDRAIKPLCDFIASRRSVLHSENAINALGEMGMPEAVPTLAGVLIDESYDFPQSYSTAAIALARCGKAGFDALVSALEQSNPRIRVAAVAGLDVSGNDEASPYLERALSDPDPGVRQRAKMRVGKPCF